jgi:predicted DNA-binding ribbon-helix-helix protein
MCNNSDSVATSRDRPLEEERGRKSTVVKRLIVLAGHKTSVSLEDAFSEGLKDIARPNGRRWIVGSIDTQRER